MRRLLSQRSGRPGVVVSKRFFGFVSSITTMVDNNGSTFYSLVPEQHTINITSKIIQDGVTVVLSKSTRIDRVANTTVVVNHNITSTRPRAAAATLILTQSYFASPPNTTFDDIGQLDLDPIPP